MWLMLGISSLLMAIKFIAYFSTHSNAILTDALESIINVAAGTMALFSIYYAARPKDENHPYGHGKIEFLSAGFEGGMIFCAGLVMIIKGVLAFWKQVEIHSLDIGLYLSSLAALVNYFMGTYLIKNGKKNHSMLMVANGKHLLSDTYSSIGLIIGLAVIYFTKLIWLDNAITIAFGLLIFYTGYKLLKESVNNLLDEADYEKLNHLADVLNKHRRPAWIDIHNLRVLKYGSRLHVDCHITLPWYENLEKSHSEVSRVEELLKQNSQNEIEFFIHADPCLPLSCPICTIQDCTVRKEKFVKQLNWTIENMLPDKKHSL